MIARLYAALLPIGPIRLTPDAPLFASALAELARVRRILARVLDAYARDAWYERSTTRVEFDAWAATLEDTDADR